MTTFIIVALGDCISPQLERTMNGFIDVISKKEGTTVLEKNSGGNWQLKPAIRSAFLDNLVATFRVNGFFTREQFFWYEMQSDEDEQLTILNAENARIFREKTRELFQLSEAELPNERFDEIWCRMCVVTPEHADNLGKLLREKGLTVVLHNGTNAIHQDCIIQCLKKFGLSLDGIPMFLSHEQACEYKAGEPNLVRRVMDGISPKSDDKVVWIRGTPARDARDFQSIAEQRAAFIKTTATQIFPPLIWVECETPANTSLIAKLIEEGLLPGASVGPGKLLIFYHDKPADVAPPQQPSFPAPRP